MRHSPPHKPVHSALLSRSQSLYSSMPSDGVGLVQSLEIHLRFQCIRPYDLRGAPYACFTFMLRWLSHRYLSRTSRGAVASVIPGPPQLPHVNGSLALDLGGPLDLSHI